MGFRSVRELADSISESGRDWISHYHRASAPSNWGQYRFADFTMGGGTPKYNAYVGSQLEATPLVGSGNNGIYCGPTPPTGMTKHLINWQQRIGDANFAGGIFYLLDYLMFYPLIDGDSTDDQIMDNTATIPRYSGGQVMLVCTTPISASASVTVNYTSDKGVVQAKMFTIEAQSVAGGLVNSPKVAATPGRIPFMTLQDGDTGVSQINSVTLSTPCGGFFAAVIVEPLALLSMLTGPQQLTEKNMMRHQPALPRIMDGAYLGIIGSNGGASQAVVPMTGHLHFAWG